MVRVSVCSPKIFVLAGHSKLPFQIPSNVTYPVKGISLPVSGKSHLGIVQLQGTSHRHIQTPGKISIEMIRGLFFQGCKSLYPFPASVLSAMPLLPPAAHWFELTVPLRRYRAVNQRQLPLQPLFFSLLFSYSFPVFLRIHGVYLPFYHISCGFSTFFCKDTI